MFVWEELLTDFTQVPHFKCFFLFQFERIQKDCNKSLRINITLIVIAVLIFNSRRIISMKVTRFFCRLQHFGPQTA